jgi:flagellar biosynthesis protein
MPMPERPEPKSAVAIRYDEQIEQAPRVLARGRGEVADRILAVAREHGIPLHEDRDLVKLLVLLDLDIEVPPHLYRALAEVLAHVYRVNGRRRI